MKSRNSLFPLLLLGLLGTGIMPSCSPLDEEDAPLITRTSTPTAGSISTPITPSASLTKTAEEDIAPKGSPNAPIKDIRVIIKTNQGDIAATLFATKTPTTVANFLNLSKKGFYKGITFHRVIKGFMIQAGDPLGTGTGGPGYTFEDEIRSDLTHNNAGILSMANPGRPNSNGSQFFITHTETPHLDGKHTVFGKVTSGMDIVNRIQQGDEIKNIQILDPTDSLFNAQQLNIDRWNAQLNH